MQPSAETIASAPGSAVAARHTASRVKSNTYRHREEWLQAAINLLAPMFAKAGNALPDQIRVAIGFPSKGGKGNCVGECWHSIASDDKHYEIFIRPDIAEPVEVLGVLTHELVHSAIPLGSGHGPVYKALALKIGLEGKMRHAMPGMHLVEVLKGFATELGPFPHASLNIQFRESAPRKKQKTHMLKAFCSGVKNAEGETTEACDYMCRLTTVHAKKGAPICGVHETRMVIEWPVEDEQTAAEGEDGQDTEGFSASRGSADPAPSAVSGGGQGGFTASPASVPVAVDGDFRPVKPREVLQPGHHIRGNMETGQSEVSSAPLGRS